MILLQSPHLHLAAGLLDGELEVVRVVGCAERDQLAADDVGHVVTEQTGEGTRSTAEQVRELARVAEELRQAVTRFKIA